MAIAALVGTAVSTGAAIDAANEKDDQNEREAAYAKDAAKAHAENIMRARRRQVAAARAATAASGTRLDEFSEINTNEIEREGAHDEMMTLLTGRRQADLLTYGKGNGAREAALNGVADLMGTGYQTGWKGKRPSKSKKVGNAGYGNYKVYYDNYNATKAYFDGEGQ